MMRQCTSLRTYGAVVVIIVVHFVACTKIERSLNSTDAPRLGAGVGTTGGSAGSGSGSALDSGAHDCVAHQQFSKSFADLPANATNPRQTIGTSIATAANTVVVGAFEQGVIPSETSTLNAPVAFVFSANTGSFIRVLQAPPISGANSVATVTRMLGNDRALMLVRRARCHFNDCELIGGDVLHIFDVHTGNLERSIALNVPVGMSHRSIDLFDRHSINGGLATDGAIIYVGMPTALGSDNLLGLVARINPSNGVILEYIAPDATMQHEQFGYDVAVNETTLAVGAPGANRVVVLQRPDHTVAATITPPSTPEQYAHFGVTLTMNDRDLIIGDRSGDAAFHMYSASDFSWRYAVRGGDNLSGINLSKSERLGGAAILDAHVFIGLPFSSRVPMIAVQSGAVQSTVNVQANATTDIWAGSSLAINSSNHTLYVTSPRDGWCEAGCSGRFAAYAVPDSSDCP